MALLVFTTFAIGLFSLANTPNTDAKKIPLGFHMAIGITILVIVVARYLLRVLVFKPGTSRANPAPRSPAKKKAILLERMTPAVHILLYFLTALMALLGIAIALPADLFSSVWLRSGAPLPADFYVYPARIWHGALSLVLMLLIAQHVLVAVYHQYLRGENYLGRMWFAPSPKSGTAITESKGDANDPGSRHP